eukprot:6175274-Pleurochrysis_carterae.AAC.1
MCTCAPLIQDKRARPQNTTVVLSDSLLYVTLLAKDTETDTAIAMDWKHLLTLEKAPVEAGSYGTTGTVKEEWGRMRLVPKMGTK